MPSDILCPICGKDDQVGKSSEQAGTRIYICNRCGYTFARVKPAFDQIPPKENDDDKS